jgi:hypothetical protein
LRAYCVEEVNVEAIIVVILVFAFLSGVVWLFNFMIKGAVFIISKIIWGFILLRRKILTTGNRPSARIRRYFQ